MGSNYENNRTFKNNDEGRQKKTYREYYEKPYAKKLGHLDTTDNF